MNIFRFTAPQHLILYKMFALSSLVLAAMLLSSPAARAGHWEFTCTGDGNNTITYAYPGMLPKYTPWPVPTAPQVGSFSLGGFGDGSDYANSSVTTVNVTVTATWKADGGQDDTPPPDVWLCESASADWSYGRSGTADDGFGDAPVPRSAFPGGAISFTASSYTSPDPGVPPPPPPHWKKYPVSGGSVTLPKRTLTAEADYPDMYGDYGRNCYANVDSYTVTVHPQPYNYRMTSHSDDGSGDLSFTYDWSSTSGNKGNLTDCYAHERVSYNGATGPHSYYPPNPFSLGSGLDNPTVLPKTDDPSASMAVTIGTDTHYVWASTSPYSTSITVPATQRYEFNDYATHETDTLIPGPDSTPTITRAITNNRPSYPPGIWWYSVTKHGFTAWKQLN